MFEAKIQQIVDMFGEKVDDKIDILYDTVEHWGDRMDDLTWKMKVAIGISLGLSIADTILLFVICKRMGR